MDRLTFINLIKDTAIKEYYRSNILPSVTIAQACLESGYGSSRLSAEFKNLFGVKAFSDWQGKKVILPTKEEYGGKVSTVNAWFKVYNSYEESIKDHTNLLLTSRYTPVRRGGDYIEQCKQLKLCGYATDSQYPSKLIAVIYLIVCKSLTNR
jgi:flagellum-specific peptidoglycan hydrolase FlgJ